MQLPQPGPPWDRVRTTHGGRQGLGMRLVVRLLGAEVFAIETESPSPDSDRGDSTSYPIGFTRSEGDQRWERGTELE